jgi:ABC-type branched-subunit amino acid transport system substrate-binding protein
MATRRINSRQGRGAFVALAVSVALLLSACSSGGAATTLPSASPASSGKVSAADIATATGFTKSSAGAAKSSLEPIKVGLVANVEGPVAQPYLAKVAAAAAKFINAELGGVAGGHPLELVTCTFGGTAQEGQLCGQKFANDPSIKFVLYPGGTVGGPEMHAANNGAKVYLCTTASPSDINVKNEFCTAGGPLSGGAIETYIKNNLHAKTLSLITIDDPTLIAIAKQQIPIFDKVGIKVNLGIAPATATDVTSAVLASQAKTADALLMYLPAASTCIPFVKAIKTLAITAPVISLPQCAEQSVVTATGDYPKFTYLDYGTSVHVPDAEMKTFQDAMNTYDGASGAFAPQTFGDVLLAAKVINQLGAKDLTTEKIAANLGSFSGPTFLGDSKLSFGNQPFPSVGSTRARFFTYKGNSKWIDATNGEWLAAG